MTTIQQDVDDTNNITPLSVEEGMDAFLNRWKDPAEVSKDDEEANSESEKETVTDEEDTQESEATEEEVETEEETEEDPDADKKEVKFVEDEEAHVKFTVDGEERTVSVKDLKRLAGQEASLTRKSQEVAEARRIADENSKVHLVGLQKMLERAEARYKPYSELDFAQLASKLSDEDYQAVKEEAVKAYEDVKFLTEELGGFMQDLEKKRVATFQEQAKECIKVLSDPKTGIEGWGEPLYNEIRDYATKSGMSKELVNSITDPNIFKILHKAMKFDSIKKISTVKKAAAPKKVIKQKGALQSKKISDKGSSAIARLKQTGDRESAAEAFMARWGDSSDED
jgi:hypothetical protein